MVHNIGLCNFDGGSDVEEDTEEESINAPPYSLLSCCTPDDASFDQVVQSDQKECVPDVNKASGILYIFGLFK